MKKQTTLLTVTTAMFVAMGILMPQIFRLIPNGGTMFSPMHLTVLLCGLICGSFMGAICGLLTPTLCLLISGTPPFPIPMLPMTVELIAYGILSGLFLILFNKCDKTRKFAYILSLLCAMVCGRVIFVIAKVACVLLFVDGAQFNVVLVEAIVGAFVQTWPAVVLQLLLIPTIMFALQKAHILEKYPYKNQD